MFGVKELKIVNKDRAALLARKEFGIDRNPPMSRLKRTQNTYQQQRYITCTERFRIARNVELKII